MTRTLPDTCGSSSVRGRSIDEDLESIFERLRSLSRLIKQIADAILEGTFTLLDVITDSIGVAIVQLCQSMIDFQSNSVRHFC